MRITWFALLGIFCLIIDIVGSELYSQQFLFATLGYYCIILWLSPSLFLKILSGLFALICTLSAGHALVIEPLMLGFIAASIALLKPVINGSPVIIMTITGLLIWFNAFVLYAISPWTIFNIIANIIIVIGLLKLTYDRRAIA